MDRKARIYLSGAVAAGLLVSVLQGCSLDEWVKVDVPEPVRVALNVPEGEAVSVGSAQVVRMRWAEFVERQTDELDREIGDSVERYEFLASLADTGLGVLGQEASHIPGGGLLVAALGGLGGLFLRKPGDGKKLRALEVSE